MTYFKEDEHDRELKEKLNKMTMHHTDIDRHTLKHGEHADLHKVSLHRHDTDMKRFHEIDEGY